MNPLRLTRKEGFLQCNTLAIVPHILKAKSTILDLRNETSVAGVIDDVDGFMNITMSDAVFVDQRNNQHSFSSYFVPARTIRYIHIPESIKIQSAINDFLTKLQGKPKRPKKVFSHKAKRTEQKHQATLREVQMAKARKEQNAQSSST